MDAGVAQLVEQVIRNDQVAGSNPVTGFVRQEDANLRPDVAVKFKYAG